MTARQPRYPKEQYSRRGREIYDREIRQLVDVEANKGKYVILDIETGVWEMDADARVAAQRLDERVPDAQPWMERVGYKAAVSFGGHGLRL